MISKSLALKVLNEALATGGDYAEIYLEENDSQSVMKMATLFPAKTSTKLLATDLYRSLWKH